MADGAQPGMSEKRIADYALIGDGETAALVHRSGAIEWLCLPHFDSAACFAALLGSEDNGCWELGPDETPTACRRHYRGDTLVLETEFETPGGTVAVIDFMPTLRGEAPDVVRIVEGRAGTVAMTSRLALRFDYGQLNPLVRSRDDGRIMAVSGPNGVLIDFAAPPKREDRRFVSRFEVSEGQRLHFVLTSFDSYGEAPKRIDPELALRQTCDFWRKWIADAKIDGPYEAQVKRSLITLGALVHRPTGAMVAAPTSSLPETPGGSRNWDYRFCWLRDSTFMLLALLRAGLHKDAEAWFNWLRKAIGSEPIDLRPFYRIDGARRAIEWEAEWLAGFNGAKPVRFGNGAAAQLQLDIYGEVIDTLHAAARQGMDHDADSDELVRLIADKLCELWEKPDAGMWEGRGGDHHYVYSKVMCWVGFNRASEWFCERDEARCERYRVLADEARAQVMNNGIDRQRGLFTAAYGEPEMDAALLRLPLVGFIDANDPVMKATVAQIERELLRDGLVWRYRPERFEDGIGKSHEGAFLAAGFWLVSVYALQGRRDEAAALFESLAGRANDLGLLSEEADASGLRGNFPQGLSHLALVVAAMNLAGNGPSDERAKDGRQK
jgi:GH15 family glucan-1,4-alpha-glucosidase